LAGLGGPYWMSPSAAMQREWRRRLLESGFHDIEYRGRATGWHEVQSLYHLAGPVERAAHAAYFQRAGQFCWERRFRKMPADYRAIWRLHARGESIVEIARALEVSESKVRYAIRRARLLAGLPETTEAYRGASGHGSYTGQVRTAIWNQWRDSTRHRRRWG